MAKLTLIAAFCFAFLSLVSSLKSVRIAAPQAIRRGETAIMTCDFDMEGEAIYSVKWYKGSYEFFRYSPKEEEPVKTFPMEGLTIDMQKSNVSKLILLNVATTLTGKYGCEVSAETSFHTKLVYADMQVVDVPYMPPLITDVKPKYRVGEMLVANCSSGPSQPATNLSWYINGEMVGSDPVERFPLPRDGKMQASFSRLSLVVRSHDFIYNRLRLRCTANILSIYNQSSEKIIDEDVDTRVDLLLPSNYLDELDEGGNLRRRNSFGNGSSGISVQSAVVSLMPLFFLVLR